MNQDKQDKQDKPALDEVKSYLRQRIAAGESVHLVPVAVDVTGPRQDERRRKRAGDPQSASPAARNAAAVSEPPAADAAPAGQPPIEAANASAANDPAAADSIERIAAEVLACTRCRLHETRTHAVPGVGPTDAGLVFIGEGPGADEDARGEPFVGRAGQLLTKIIESVKLRREEVFITNIVKCRPPNNRDPKPDEIAACEPFLKRQLGALAPKVICALGRHAAMLLLQTNESMARLRQGERHYEGIRVFPTYHPAALLRNPQWKRPVWEDIQNVRSAYDAPREKR